MPLTAYLKIEDIPGESLRAGHEDEIDIVGIDWEIERVMAFRRGAGRRRARVEVEPLGLMKVIDKASPYLAEAALKGKSFPEAVLSVRKDSGEAHLDYLTITMENVMVSAYEFKNDGLEDPLDVIQERVELVFENVTYKYIVQNDDHSAGEEHEIEYDISAGV